MRSTYIIPLLLALVAGVAFGQKSQEAKKTKNLREYETAVGLFRVVSCRGDYSTDPEQGEISEGRYNLGGGLLMRCDNIQDPAGRWHRGHPDNYGSIECFADLGGSTFMIANYGVYRYSVEDGFNPVLEFDRYQPVTVKSTPVKSLFTVSRGSHSNFGGILRYDQETGQWSEIRYEGPDLHWVVDATLEGDTLALSLIAENAEGALDDRVRDILVFDTKAGTFGEPQRASPGKQE
ncbi:MAG: hypothetical protein HY461_00660 [Parcubacteria group bacterium]|nr:hypothetical protein [Parcubacteria group bacterium]